jgi:hypothetical protein
MPDKNAVADVDAFADEGVAGDLAVCSDDGVLLYLDEGPNLRMIADCAPI